MKQTNKANGKAVRAPQFPVRFSARDFLEYASYHAILARVVHDRSVIPLLGELEGDILELGAGKHDYSTAALKVKSYIRSDYKPPAGDSRIRIDATAIDFPDQRFDSVVCMSALEHIEDYEKVISETYRILKPGGRFLLCTPWLFPYHGAPDDYTRFSPSLLRSKLSKFEIKSLHAVGNFWLSQAVFLQRPKWSRPQDATAPKLYDPVLRLIGMAFMAAGGGKCGDDDNYALLYTALCRKPA